MVHYTCVNIYLQFGKQILIFSLLLKLIENNLSSREHLGAKYVFHQEFQEGHISGLYEPDYYCYDNRCTFFLPFTIGVAEHSGQLLKPATGFG